MSRFLGKKKILRAYGRFLWLQSKEVQLVVDVIGRKVRILQADSQLCQRKKDENRESFRVLTLEPKE